MELAQVTGKIWATKKADTLEGQRFILTQVINSAGEPGRLTVVAADNIGAGVGDLVLIVKGGAARQVLGKNVPVDAAVIGIVDSVEYH